MEGPIAHGGRPSREPASPDLVDALLEAAGLAGPWVVDSIPTIGWVNSNTIIRLGSGRRVVVRRYEWPFVGEEQLFDRRAKEAWLHPRLAEAGVPVAEFLATADVGDQRGALLSHLPGDTLGSVAGRTAPDALVPAWRDAGAALARAHRIEPPSRVAGFVSDGGVVPFPEGSFGGFHRDRLVRYANEVARLAPELRVDPIRIAGLAESARPVIDATRLVLGHGDSHAWNVLVTEDADGRWRLSGWLDWEFAWVGDAAWDHMRMMVQRFANFGPIPDAWWEGYGTRPPELNLAVAVLHFMLWKALDHFAGIDSRDAEIALTWLTDLPTHLDDLEALLA